jgi:flavin reductase (DIM6/NTAB) family NADH-FMN oxidoreductase RutF
MATNPRGFQSSAAASTPIPDVVDATLWPTSAYFGAPVVVVSTLDPDGTARLAPTSAACSHWHTVILSLNAGSPALANLQRQGQCVLNVPGSDLGPRLQRLDGSADAGDCGFAAAGLTPLASRIVLPSRAAECPFQLEAELTAVHPSRALPSLAVVSPTINATIVELIIRHVHVASYPLVPEAGGVDWASWDPFRSPRFLAN